jgi:hypothetical protein
MSVISGRSVRNWLVPFTAGGGRADDHCTRCAS